MSAASAGSVMSAAAAGEVQGAATSGGRRHTVGQSLGIAAATLAILALTARGRRTT
ncbi:hypothetical protein GCM10009811_16980 [Nostocoides veronense]|uniref:Uncharacterized protein n=2 Tax=Nostocoides veronense TaxID=330836 RepID=A0ABN2LLP7_9MICO